MRSCKYWTGFEVAAVTFRVPSDEVDLSTHLIATYHIDTSLVPLSNDVLGPSWAVDELARSRLVISRRSATEADFEAAASQLGYRDGVEVREHALLLPLD